MSRGGGRVTVMCFQISLLSIACWVPLTRHQAMVDPVPRVPSFFLDFFVFFLEVWLTFFFPLKLRVDPVQRRAKEWAIIRP